MIIPEPTSFIESSKALTTAVRNSGITMNEARTAFESLTMTSLDAEVDLIGFSYSVNPDNLLVVGSDLVPNKIYTSSCSRPELIQELHNCNNCGGTVDEKGYCRFCGSRVYFFGS